MGRNARWPTPTPLLARPVLSYYFCRAYNESARSRGATFPFRWVWSPLRESLEQAFALLALRARQSPITKPDRRGWTICSGFRRPFRSARANASFSRCPYTRVLTGAPFHYQSGEIEPKWHAAAEALPRPALERPWLRRGWRKAAGRPCEHCRPQGPELNPDP